MKKARILLITPNLKGIKDGLNRIQPSLGLMTIAQSLINNNHIVKIHDTALEGWDNKVDLGNNKVLLGQSDKEIKNVIEEFNPDIVGISILFSNLNESGHTIARITKSINPKIHVLIGGNHITNSLIDYQHNITHPGDDIPLIKDLEDKNIDFAMVGESDFNIIELVNNSLNFNLYNKSGYNQIYHYIITDTNGMFNNQEGEFTVEPYSNLEFGFQAQDSNINESYINFSIWPVYHEYSKKELSFLINNSNLLGDINNDSVVNIIDVILVVNIILDESNNQSADLNNDGLVNILDIVLIIDFILS